MKKILYIIMFSLGITASSQNNSIQHIYDFQYFVVLKNYVINVNTTNGDTILNITESGLIPEIIDVENIIISKLQCQKSDIQKIIYQNIDRSYCYERFLIQKIGVIKPYELIIINGQYSDFKMEQLYYIQKLLDRIKNLPVR